MSGSTTDPGDRSSAEIERDVESTRARVTDTLDQLRDRASPGQLMDQVVDYFRGSGGADFAQNLGQAVRNNPVPVLLIGTGLAWLALSGFRTTSSDSIAARTPLPAPGLGPDETMHGGATPSSSGDAGPSLTERAASTAGEARDRAGAAAEGLRSTASDIAGQARDTVSSAYSGLADTAASLTGRVSGTTGTAMQRASELGRDTRDQAARAGQSAREGLGWIMKEQPLVLGALGVALGAAVGALLPSTEVENRAMGEASDALTQQVQGAAQETYSRVREAAGDHLERARTAAAETYDRVKERLDEGGLSPSKLGEALGDVAQNVRETARDVAQGVASDTRDAVGSGNKPA